ncbi:unnamed protein product [Arctia plantaginis]|uniref:Uncharacterized protein n=1 Tax=Arctia plantaginis TaxID=874455 RepID=A0A8S1BAT0_ARCPL|nr:unnamed protein product [Arctia plantaginis]
MYLHHFIYIKNTHKFTNGDCYRSINRIANTNSHIPEQRLRATSALSLLLLCAHACHTPIYKSSKRKSTILSCCHMRRLQIGRLHVRRHDLFGLHDCVRLLSTLRYYIRLKYLLIQNGRANTAKATYAFMGVVILYLTLKPKSKK